MNVWLSVIIFVLAYGLIASDKVHKTVVALLGASLMLALRLVSFKQAVGAVDMNVIFLLVGMMMAVFILTKTGFFEWVAISVAKYARGNPLLIMILLLSVTAFLSAFLDNVTTVILLIPVSILIFQLLDISPIPLVIMEALASNIGGTATLIGDPPNIIIGSSAGLSFNDFLFNLTPVITLVFIVFIATVFLVFRNKMVVAEDVRKRVVDAIPSLAIVDKPNMIRALIILGVMMAAFFFHTALAIEPGIIALVGSMIMLIVCRADVEETFQRVEWGVLFFFIGMFMMIAALEVNGVIHWIGNQIIHAAGNNLFALCIIILWGSAVLSSILDNIPFVITMVPLIKQIIAHYAQANGVAEAAAIQQEIAFPLWWSLSLGACLGGNGTLIGASANIMSARISERNGYPVTFARFFRYGTPFTLQALIVCTLYLWWRYF